MKNTTRGIKALIVVLACAFVVSVGFNIWFGLQPPNEYQLSLCRNELESCQSQLESAEGQVSSLQSQLQSAEGQVSSLQSKLQSAENQVSSLQVQLESCQSEVSSLETELSECQRYGKLQHMSVIAVEEPVNQGAGHKSHVTTFIADYAGYVHVSGTSTTSNGYIMVTCSYTSYPYNNYRYSLGYGKSVIVPVLPGTITVYFGNTNLFGGATATISVYYHY